MGITRAADCGVDVVGVGGMEFLRRGATGSSNDEAGRTERVRVCIVRFARPDFGEKDLRDGPFAVFFGWLAFMLAS